MFSSLHGLTKVEYSMETQEVVGPLAWQRHGIGHGGINSLPLPERVVAGARALRPRLVRIFMQEYLDVYRGNGAFDWAVCDRYMQSVAATGAKIVAAFTMKPPALFPAKDHAIWQPRDKAAWHNLIKAVVRRYSVERPWVTHWEAGNETDLGENGGCPFLVNSDEDYFEYYKTIIAAVLEAFPQAKVGGPALANPQAPWLASFLEMVKARGVQFDFLSWHVYSSAISKHLDALKLMQGLTTNWPGRKPELMVTEWNKWFDPVSIEELAFEPARAAHTAATILEMMRADADGRLWSFYYHLWDQTAFAGEFARFFAKPEIMTHHWNELPHRFGLFGVGEQVRPQYFVYQMLSRMGEEQVAVDGEHPKLRIAASKASGTPGIPGKTYVLLVNFSDDVAQAEDLIAQLDFRGLTPGRKQLTVTRIDHQRAWSQEELELKACESREVDARTAFKCQIYAPANSVTLVQLQDLND